jgi:hypothetical protein
MWLSHAGITRQDVAFTSQSGICRLGLRMWGGVQCPLRCLGVFSGGALASRPTFALQRY